MRKGEGAATGGRRWPVAALIAAVAGMCGAMALGAGLPSRHPAERAAAQLGERVLRRLVVPGDRGGYDVWLFSDAPLAKMRQRLEMAREADLVLKGGYRVGSVYGADLDGSLVAGLRGTPPQQLRVSSHLDGTLIVLPGAGEGSEAPAWSPSYRPQPVLLPHGPLR